jgi:hypothetical protein
MDGKTSGETELMLIGCWALPVKLHESAAARPACYSLADLECFGVPRKAAFSWGKCHLAAVHPGYSNSETAVALKPGANKLSLFAQG